jgi:hypothetical protein
VADVPNVAPINAWAAKVTKGLITQPIPPRTPFNMVITNAVYFKGDWLYAFEKTATSPKPFTTRANTKVLVPMMTKRFRNEGAARPALYADTPAWSGVRLPYKGGTLSAVILLPKDPKPVTPVVPVAQELLSNTWTAPDKLDVSLPRFKIKNDLKLTAVRAVDLATLCSVRASAAAPHLQNPSRHANETTGTSKLSMWCCQCHVFSDCLLLCCCWCLQQLKSLGMVAALDPRRANFNRLSADPLFITDVLQSVSCGAHAPAILLLCTSGPHTAGRGSMKAPCMLEHQAHPCPPLTPNPWLAFCSSCCRILGTDSAAEAAGACVHSLAKRCCCCCCCCCC